MAYDLIETFTKETILYDPATHHYTTVDGQTLVSGSAYAKQNTPDFDADKIAGFVATKLKARKSDILAMWAMNGDLAAKFGTALHLAMEQWFRFRDLGTSKGYHRPKIRYLRDAVETFPFRDANAVPEAVISDSQGRRCGRTDLLVINDDESIGIKDYKTDSNIEKNIEKHTLQLNFYREILEKKGFRVKDMELWIYDGAWSAHTLKRKEIL